jgi:hypothetical protein
LPSQVIVDLQAFQPSDGDWRPLDALLSELWGTGQPGEHIRDLFGLLERFPEDDGAGVLWSVVHGLESLADYEPELVRSVQRRPSELAIIMVGRLLNSGTSQVAEVCLTDLLRSVASDPGVPAAVRESASRWVAKHA